MNAFSKASWALAGVALTLAAAVALWPRARAAIDLVSAQDDPARGADVQLSAMPAETLRDRITAEIGDAVAADDAELAVSLIELATERGVAIDAEHVRRVDEAARARNSASGQAYRFASGFVTGDISDGASLAGTVAGDLFVYGDLRDIAREGWRLVSGAETDRVVLGLATVGVAVTAGTYLSAGSAAPVRAGVSLIKDARKLGRVSAGLTDWTNRSVRALTTTPAVGTALARAAKDVARVQSRAGTRAAFDVLKVADGPKELARAARLAEKKGGQTRAVLKILGRGALAIGSLTMGLASWLLSFALAVFGFLVSLKAFVERTAERWLRRSKRRRAETTASAVRLEPAIA